jgi:hypothetical protein
MRRGDTLRGHSMTESQLPLQMHQRPRASPLNELLMALDGMDDSGLLAADAAGLASRFGCQIQHAEGYLMFARHQRGIR